MCQNASTGGKGLNQSQTHVNKSTVDKNLKRVSILKKLLIMSYFCFTTTIIATDDFWKTLWQKEKLLILFNTIKSLYYHFKWFSKISPWCFLSCQLPICCMCKRGMCKRWNDTTVLLYILLIIERMYWHINHS